MRADGVTIDPVLAKNLAAGLKLPDDRDIAEAARKLGEAMEDARKHIALGLEEVSLEFPRAFAAALARVRLETRITAPELSTRAGRAQALLDGFTLRATYTDDGDWSELRVRNGDFEERCRESPNEWEHCPNPFGWEEPGLTWSIAGEATSV